MRAMAQTLSRGHATRPDQRESAPGRNRTCDTRFRKPLLYPLSYEGVRLISYLPGDTHLCLGVPTSAIWSAFRPVGRVSLLVEDIRSIRPRLRAVLPTRS